MESLRDTLPFCCTFFLFQPYFSHPSLRLVRLEVGREERLEGGRKEEVTRGSLNQHRSFVLFF